MGGFGDAIRYLYQNFILRDILSFVTPGAIVVLTAVYLFWNEMFKSYIPWPYYILIFGIFYMVGFAIQCFGELIGFIRFTPYPENTWNKRWRIFTCSWRKNYCKHEDKENYDKREDRESNIWWWKEHEELAKFFEATKEDTKDNENVRQGYERLVVLQQMCGNNFLAILVTAIFVPIAYYGKSPLFLLILGIPLLLSLFWCFRVMLLRKYVREQVIREIRPKGRMDT